MTISHLVTKFMAMAPAPEGAEQEGHMAVMLVFYVGLFAIFYFLLIRPQSKQRQETQKMQDALAKGDRVTTTGGIYATIHKVEEETITLEVADGVRIKFRRAAIAERLRAADGSDPKDDGKKKKEEKAK